ncbi:hypothetical protein IVG45_05115 [Methylomonas sp. LL1]|uniref:efflux RND transporter periplasmic adaptor subunit n=1 Tax=Methylomonas sp. LL1 TaxID=2785785 RepID=UPI0018C449CD|nr:hypothetical protein [Methylomonas sp. LL1]QPK64347.1 hypothetical protein IVG45_05115 [Methylomonas sp. LL1]
MYKLIRFACLAAALLAASSPFADADQDDEPRAMKPADSAASNTHIAGIKTQRLEASMQQPEFSAYGTVVNLEPLVALRQQFLAARAQQDSARAKYQEADLNLTRTQDLHRHDIVSTRRLQEQQAQWRNDQANLATSNYQQQTILATSRLQWGELLTDWFTQNHGKQAEQFLNHRAQLLQITLPANSRLAPDLRTVDVDEHGRRDHAIKASLISVAPQADPVTQGERYFFKSEGRNLPFGAHITAWITNGTPENTGVIIPDNAVVWHLGQAFIFIKSVNGEFQRRLLPELIPAKTGYFASGDFKPGDEIVITGAQTLLSQELKNLIPSEDND